MASWFVEVPIPPSRECNPNWRAEPDGRGKYPSRQTEQRMKRAAHDTDREAGWLAGKNALNTLREPRQAWRTLMHLPRKQIFLARYTITWPCGHDLLDYDNAVASLKWMQDGLSRALERDDKYWRSRVKQVQTFHPCVPGTGGGVVLELIEGSDDD